MNGLTRAEDNVALVVADIFKQVHIDNAGNMMPMDTLINTYILSDIYRYGGRRIVANMFSQLARIKEVEEYSNVKLSDCLMIHPFMEHYRVRTRNTEQRDYLQGRIGELKELIEELIDVFRVVLESDPEKFNGFKIERNEHEHKDELCIPLQISESLTLHPTRLTHILEWNEKAKEEIRKRTESRKRNIEANLLSLKKVRVDLRKMNEVKYKEYRRIANRLTIEKIDKMLLSRVPKVRKDAQFIFAIKNGAVRGQLWRPASV